MFGGGSRDSQLRFQFLSRILTQHTNDCKVQYRDIGNYLTSEGKIGDQLREKTVSFSAFSELGDNYTRMNTTIGLDNVSEVLLAKLLSIGI